MKLSTAYCIELKRFVTIVETAQLYNDKESSFYKKKLTFSTGEELNSSFVIPINLNSSTQEIYFRSAPKENHIEYRYDLKQLVNNFINYNSTTLITNKNINYLTNILNFKNAKELYLYATIKKIKKYGNSYCITVKERPLINNIATTLSIYIKEETISNYKYRSIFKSQMEKIMKIYESHEIYCFTADYFPKLIKVKKDDQIFLALKLDIVDIKNIIFDSKN